MDVQTSNESQLRNFETLIDRLQKLDGYSLLFLAEQQDGRLVGKCVIAQRDAGGRLLQTNDVVAFGSALTQPRKEILFEREQDK